MAPRRMRRVDAMAEIDQTSREDDRKLGMAETGIMAVAKRTAVGDAGNRLTQSQAQLQNANGWEEEEEGAIVPVPLARALRLLCGRWRGAQAEEGMYGAAPPPRQPAVRAGPIPIALPVPPSLPPSLLVPPPSASDGGQRPRRTGRLDAHVRWSVEDGGIVRAGERIGTLRYAPAGASAVPPPLSSGGGRPPRRGDDTPARQEEEVGRRRRRGRPAAGVRRRRRDGRRGDGRRRSGVRRRRRDGRAARAVERVPPADLQEGEVRERRGVRMRRQPGRGDDDDCDQPDTRGGRAVRAPGSGRRPLRRVRRGHARPALRRRGQQRRGDRDTSGPPAAAAAAAAARA
ncbi:hypothetical protein THAOC_17827, partial [Thalassiosira oceanica]